MGRIVDVAKRFIAAADRRQRKSRVAGPAYGVVKKFSDDNLNLLVVALGWYGFTAIYPLLLVIVAIFGYIGAGSLGSGIVKTLHQFPVIGAQFNPGRGGSNLHGSIAGVVVGVVGLLYGAQGVTQTAERAMNQVWNLDRSDRPGFLPRLLRSFGGLAIIGVAFVVNATAASIAAGHRQPIELRVGLVAGLLLLNIAFYVTTFRVLTAADVSVRQLVPGSATGAVFFTILMTVGAGLVQHQLRHSSATYGALGSVVGVVAFLLLLAKLTMLAAELNPVLAMGLWPRSLPTTPPTEADDRVLRALAHEERSRRDERISVGFGTDTLEAPAANTEREQSNAPDGREPHDAHEVAGDPPREPVPPVAGRSG
jgi:uncharacterized BrkB/YihY/UPF0761 family membrane protein